MNKTPIKKLDRVMFKPYQQFNLSTS